MPQPPRLSLLSPNVTARNEYSQSRARFLVLGLAALYLLLHRASAPEAAPLQVVLTAALAYLGAALALHLWIVRRPQPQRLRRIGAMCADLGTCGWFMHLAGPEGLLVYPLILWVIISYGYRYGTGYMSLALLLGGAVFAGVGLFSPQWRGQGALVPGLLAGMAALVLFIRTMLLEMERVNRELAEHARQLEHQATHDTLTGLPNRALLHSFIEQELARLQRRPRRLLGVLFLDLDGFKAVNDRCGHAAGDRLLKEAAERVRGTVRVGDLAARVGGDEFVVAVADVAEERTLERIATKLLAVLGRPYGGVAAQAQVQLSASIGIVVVDDGKIQPEEVLRRADVAMYAAKQQGRDRYAWYRRGMPYSPVRVLRGEAEHRAGFGADMR